MLLAYFALSILFIEQVYIIICLFKTFNVAIQFISIPYRIMVVYITN